MRLLVGYILLLLPTLLFAQYQPTIASGRPGVAINTQTVGRGVYQVETGMTLGWEEVGSQKVRDITESTILRIGILERLEVSGAVIGSAVESRVFSGRNSWDRGISATELGGRYSFLDNEGWVPALVLDAAALLRAQDEEFQRDHTGARFIVSADWGLTEATNLTVNLNRTWVGDGTRNTGYVVSFGLSLSDRLGSFVEAYGDLSKPATAYFDGGFAYLIGNHVQLDAAVGWEGTNGVPSYYLDFGVSFRIDGRVLRERSIQDVN
ncbi:transporter [Neolewinella sp.]|uniref:transporter n=1 Tax=Neolewinella sp. TaxID=2993543 RepID=UPI003B51E557